MSRPEQFKLVLFKSQLYSQICWYTTVSQRHNLDIDDLNKLLTYTSKHTYIKLYNRFQDKLVLFFISELFSTFFFKKYLFYFCLHWALVVAQRGAHAPESMGSVIVSQLPHSRRGPGSMMREWTHVPCTRRQILNHCTTREVPLLDFQDADNFSSRLDVSECRKRWSYSFMLWS